MMENQVESPRTQRNLFYAAALTGIVSRPGKHDATDDAMEAFDAAEALIIYIEGVDRCNADEVE